MNPGAFVQIHSHCFLHARQVQFRLLVFGSWTLWPGRMKPPTTVINGSDLFQHLNRVRVYTQLWLVVDVVYLHAVYLICFVQQESARSTEQQTRSSTRTQLKRTSQTWQLQKTAFAPPIISAITQLHSLYVSAASRIWTLTRPKQKEGGRRSEGERCGSAAVVDRVRVNLLNKWQWERALGCWWGSLLHKYRSIISAALVTLVPRLAGRPAPAHTAMLGPGGPAGLGCREVTLSPGCLEEAVQEGWANTSSVCSADWAETSRVKISGCQHRGWHLQSTVTPSMSPVSPTTSSTPAEGSTAWFHQVNVVPRATANLFVQDQHHQQPISSTLHEWKSTLKNVKNIVVVWELGKSKFSHTHLHLTQINTIKGFKKFVKKLHFC